MTSQLIDADAYTTLYEASEELSIVSSGELMLHQLRHPFRGLLTAIQIGDDWFVTKGDFIDKRDEDYGDGEVVSLDLWRSMRAGNAEGLSA